jgi:hypothetical protein
MSYQQSETKREREDQTLVKERATWSEIKKQNENENCQ